MAKHNQDNRPIRVLHLTLSYNPVETRYLEDMAQGFARDPRFEFDYGVLEGKPDPELESNLECPVRWLDLGHRQVSGPTLSGLIRLWKHIHSGEYDIVITHRHKPARMMALIRPFLRLRGIISVWHEGRQFTRKGRALIARHLMRGNWLHVGVSDAVAEDIGRTGPGMDQVVTIHNCVDIESLRSGALPRSTARRELGLPENATVLGTLGRTTAKKGHRFLIEAMPEILRNLPDAHLVIIGGGKEDDNLARQVREMGLDEKVTLTGRIRDGYRYLPAIDLYLMPSLSEAFGISLIEAMALGLPVLGARAGGIPEVIGNDALVFEPGDAQAIASAVRHFLSLSGKEREALRAFTSRRVEELFGIERYQKAYTDLAWRLAGG